MTYIEIFIGETGYMHSIRKKSTCSRTVHRTSFMHLKLTFLVPRNLAFSAHITIFKFLKLASNTLKRYQLCVVNWGSYARMRCSLCLHQRENIYSEYFKIIKRAMARIMNTDYYQQHVIVQHS